MFKEKKDSNGLTIRAYEGDAKALLAFSLTEDKLKNLAGFTVACTPKGKATYYLFNQLQLEDPDKHVQNKTEPSYSSINAPIQKFRWLHVPGLFHQDDQVFYGLYTYTVTPRYFDQDGALQPLDKTLSSDIIVDVKPFKQQSFELGFTRGFVQSQGFVHHFGPKAPFRPARSKSDGHLVFNTTTVAGRNSNGDEYTYLQEYQWSGFTARSQVFAILKEVQDNKALSLDVFAYDLDEPDVIKTFLELGKEGRIRIILDNASLHHNESKPAAEDQFESMFKEVAKKEAALKRGRFARFQHNKVLIVKQGNQPQKVLCGSTNFSVTGLYVNSNHVAVFNDTHVAELFDKVFNEAWVDDVNAKAFIGATVSQQPFAFKKAGLPEMVIHFSPHAATTATTILNHLVQRVKDERSSVLFAVMESDPKVKGPVASTLIHLHEKTDLFTAGITDSVNDITLYKPSSRQGLRVTGKPGATLLPGPFDKEANLGMGHQVHHKFIVCGFNQPNAVVWFGSSNLALGGEEQNGDQLIEVHDTDVATVFAVEAISLVDHFNFRDKYESKAQEKSTKATAMHLFNNDKWAQAYYDKDDLHYLDRLLFIGESMAELPKETVPAAG
jgi:PLD-like domain